MKKLIKRIVLAFAIMALIAFSLLGYAYFVEPRRLVVVKAELTVPNFDSRLNGLKIVAISDIHGGSNHVPAERLRELVELANRQDPDLIVLLGDYVSQIGSIDGPLKMPLEEVAANLKGFNARYGAFAVIGNHDWWYDDKATRSSFESAGIKVLENETATIDINGVPLHLWGIEDLWRRHRVPTAPFDLIAEKTNVIALTHNPDSLLQSPPEISIMIAGHSHGGQVNFPLFGRRAFVNDPRFMYGEAVVDGKHVYVTSGVGTSVVPLRFRVVPEIAVLTLNSK